MINTLRDKKIAHVITESRPFGGAQRNTLLTLKGLVSDGYETELICGTGGPLIPAAREAGVLVHSMPDLVRPVAPLKDWRTLLRLCQLFRSRQYDIVHTHSSKAGLLGRLAAWWVGVPVVIHTCHGVPFEMKGDLKSRAYIAVERLLGSITDSFVCVGDVLRQEILAWQIVPETKLTTIYSGIDFSSYIPRRPVPELKKELGLEKAWPIVGCIGRLSEQKSQYYLVEALALLTDKYPHIALLLVGDGELRPLLERKLQTLGLVGKVSLLGERNDIADLLNVFDLYAMSSRWEGVGRALTEAMYWRLPVVATSVNGVTELICQEETGLLVPPCDPPALAAAIDRLASDPILAKRLGLNARQKVEEMMDGRQMVLAIEELYQKFTMLAPSPGPVHEKARVQA